MICRIGDVVRCGRVVSPTADVSPTAVADAVRADEPTPNGRISVSCPEPSPLHEAVGCIHADMGLRTKTAVARAARSRGLTTPHDDDLRAARQELAESTVESAPLQTHHGERVETDTALDQARIRAAEARGRLQECRESGLETDAAKSRLDEALRALSEAETAAIAARQKQDRVREHQRERRDSREQKFRLEDRVANYEREARAHLVDELREEFRAELSSLPGTNAGATHDNPFDADPVSAALAIARLGELAAPVVLAVDRFESPASASEWLDAPVIYL